MPPPGGVRRLFGEEEELLARSGRSRLLARLLEDGDSADLRWLFAELGAAEIRDWLAEHGRRRLSRRSAAFWEVVLGEVASSAPPAGNPYWPL
jgi:hypothetical protein